MDTDKNNTISQAEFEVFKANNLGDADHYQLENLQRLMQNGEITREAWNRFFTDLVTLKCGAKD